MLSPGTCAPFSLNSQVGDWEATQIGWMMETEDWTLFAKCRGVHGKAYPEVGHVVAANKFITDYCESKCRVKWKCLDAGMMEDHGVWGGLTAKDRKRVLRKMGRVKGSGRVKFWQERDEKERVKLLQEVVGDMKYKGEGLRVVPRGAVVGVVDDGDGDEVQVSVQIRGQQQVDGRLVVRLDGLAPGRLKKAGA